MSIVLSHQSALRYWLTKTGAECASEPVDSAGLVTASARMADIKRALLPLDFSQNRPLHVLVGERSRGWRLKSVRQHVWGGALPPGALCGLADQNYVSSPEFTFVQMASRQPIQETVEIGCHLCGTFAVGDVGRGYVGARPALTTPERIASFIEEIPGAYGVAAARRALRHVVAGTASPMEVLLVMVLSLPPELGGWGMSGILANQLIPVEEHLRRLAGTSYFVGDVYFPAVRGNLEYDSEQFHTGRHRLDHTQTRRNILEAMGIKTMSATWGQVSSFERLESFVGMVQDRFGIERRAFTDEERVAQMDLYIHLSSSRATLF